MSLPKIYLSKWDKLYKYLNCQVDIPINDLDAYKNYPEHRWIYNRLILAELQGLKCAPLPIEPEIGEYPVVVKPIINLYGMGLNSRIIKNQSDFYENYWYNTDFWTQFLTGEHLSYDIFIINGKPVWWSSFRGHSDSYNFGAFTYWESLPTTYKDLDNPNIKLILSKLGCYTGIVNIETIGDYVIEGHLRMGDIDQFVERVILKQLVNIYTSGKCTLDPEKFSPGKIYMFPVFVDDRNHDLLDKVQRLEPEETEQQVRLNSLGTLTVQIDDMTCAYPGHLKRFCNITTGDYQSGYRAQGAVLKFLDEL